VPALALAHALSAAAASVMPPAAAAIRQARPRALRRPLRLIIVDLHRRRCLAERSWVRRTTEIQQPETS
jgi:hypothetical protein